MLRREVHATTVLVANGRPKALIVAPKRGPFADAARQVSDAIKRATGVALPLKSPLDVTDTSRTLPERARGLMLTAEAKKTPLLIIGNLSNNSAMFEPHLRRWFVCGRGSFAEGTFRLATYENPWGTGVGYCLLGAADEAGLAKGVGTLKEVVQKHAKDGSFILPRTVAPGRDPFAGAAGTYKRLARPERPEWMKGFRESEKMWLGYGNVRSLYRYVFATELGYMNSDELHAVENEMLATLLMFPAKVKWYRPGGTWLTDRHETFKNPRTYLACEHLLTVGRPNQAAKEQLGKVAKGPEDYLSYFARNAYRCDHEDIMADHSWTNITWFALLTGEWEHFSSGLGFQAGIHGLLRTDNLGSLAGHNMYEGIKNLYLKSYVYNVVRTAAWWYQDGRFRWLLENLPLDEKAPYSVLVDLPLDGIEPRKPTEWLGALSVPVSPHSYSEAVASPKWSKPGIPREQTVDRLTLREGFAPEDQFVSLDGFQHEYQPLGLNSVIRYVDRGKLFLVATTGKDGNYYKSGVTVSRGVEKAPEPWGVAKVVGANLDDLTLVATRVPELNGSDWTRYVFWKRGSYFLFLDDVKALEPGLLNLTATWRTCLPAELTADGWRQVQDDVTFHLKPTFRLAQQAGQPLPDEYQNEILPWLLRQSLSFEAAEAGDCTAFQNLVYATGPVDEQTFEARRVNASVCLIKGVRKRGGGTERELALVGIASERLAELGIETDADMFYLSTDRAALAGGSALSLEGDVLLKGKGQATRPLSKKAQRRVTTRLENWWIKAERATGDQPPPLPAKDLKAAWQFDEFQGPPCRAEPETVAKAEDGKSWVASFGTEVALAKVVLVGSHRALPKVSVEFSNDGFANDARPAGEPTQRTRIVGPFGKSAFRTHLLAVFPGQKASSVRVRTDAKRVPDSSAFEFLLVERREPEVVRLTHVPGTGLLALNRINQLAVLNAKGKPIWQHTLEHKPTALEALDTDGDGKEELVVADGSAHLCTYSASGKLKEKRLLKTEHERFKDFFRFRKPYSLGLWQADKKGVPSLFMGTYQSVAWIGPDGEIVCWPPNSKDKAYRTGYIWRALVYWDRALRQGIDFNGDGVEDTAVLGRSWAMTPYLSFFDGKKLDALKEYELPNARPLGLEQVDLNGQQVVLAATERHLGLYSLRGADEFWHVHFSTPAAAYCLYRPADRTLIAFAKRDGMVLLLDDSGKVVKRQVLRPELSGIAAAEDKLFVSSNTGITVLDSELKPIGFAPEPARFLAPTEKGLVASDTRDGRIVAWKVRK